MFDRVIKDLRMMLMIGLMLEEVWRNKRIEYVRVECKIGIEMLEMIKGMVRDHLGVQN